MIDHYLLFLLAPYALLLVLALRKRHSRTKPVMLLLFLTIIIVWSVLYTVYCIRPFSNDIKPEDAFASVEEIMRSVEKDWIIRYLIPRYGWLPSAAFFGVCWVIARVFTRRVDH